MPKVYNPLLNNSGKSRKFSKKKKKNLRYYSQFEEKSESDYLDSLSGLNFAQTPTTQIQQQFRNPKNHQKNRKNSKNGGSFRRKPRRIGRKFQSAYEQYSLCFNRSNMDQKLSQNGAAGEKAKPRRSKRHFSTLNEQSYEKESSLQNKNGKKDGFSYNYNLDIDTKRSKSDDPLDLKLNRRDISNLTFLERSGEGNEEETGSVAQINNMGDTGGTLDAQIGPSKLGKKKKQSSKMKKRKKSKQFQTLNFSTSSDIESILNQISQEKNNGESQRNVEDNYDALDIEMEINQ